MAHSGLRATIRRDRISLIPISKMQVHLLSVAAPEHKKKRAFTWSNALSVHVENILADSSINNKKIGTRSSNIGGRSRVRFTRCPVRDVRTYLDTSTKTAGDPCECTHMAVCVYRSKHQGVIVLAPYRFLSLCTNASM